MKRALNNPFVTNGYEGDEYFCDRVEETREITELLTNENNIALISPRRLGKTDLIKHCFNQEAIRAKYYTFVIDIYATASVTDFVNCLGRTILETLKPLGRKVWEKFVNVIKSVRQEITIDINNNPVWSLQLANMPYPDITLQEIFSFLENADKPCLVAIDEFQQIMRYGDKNIEALLRTYMQQCNNAHFVFCGSRRHLMSEMFLSPARPFYQSVVIYNLDKIPFEKYCLFAQKQFADYGNRSIGHDTVEAVYNMFDGITANLQRMMNIMFFKTSEGTECTTDMIEDAIDYYLRITSEVYEALLRQMPEKQRQLFLTIAVEGEVKNISSGKFTKKYHLVSPSSAVSAVKGLLERDFITEENGTYRVYDKFFALWLKRKGLL